MTQPTDDEWGCDYCRNDGKLNENNVCPICDAQYGDHEELSPEEFNEIAERHG